MAISEIEQYFKNIEENDLLIELEEQHYYLLAGNKDEYSLLPVQNINIYSNGKVQICRKGLVAYEVLIPKKEMEQLKQYLKTLPIRKNEVILMQPAIEHIHCKATVYFDKYFYTTFVNSFNIIYPDILSVIYRNSSLVKEQLVFTPYVWDFIK